MLGFARSRRTMSGDDFRNHRNSSGRGIEALGGKSKGTIRLLSVVTFFSAAAGTTRDDEIDRSETTLLHLGLRDLRFSESSALTVGVLIRRQEKPLLSAPGCELKICAPCMLLRYELYSDFYLTLRFFDCNFITCEWTGSAAMI